MEDSETTELKQQFGEIAIATFPDGSEFVFKRPPRAAYDMWQDARDKDVSRSTAARQLAQACLVKPDFGSLIAALDKCPGALLSADGILDLLVGMAGGLGSGLSVKKV